jgi:guanosine-3',5'-bis(diphosphate) 3'-pyrophosphohydrolase
MMTAHASSQPAILLRTLQFAARKHRDHRRKGSNKAPYINHLIDVARLLAEIGEVRETTLLQAAILHDTLEDTETTRTELEREFGAEVAAIVAEVTDDKSLPKAERKRLQIADAPSLSPPAKQLKIADKISNINEIGPGEPPDWDAARRREYLAWAQQVVSGCRGVNAMLERHFDEIVAERHCALQADAR